MIEDAFSDKIDKNTFGKSITTIYTKTNKKPNKREINAAASKAAKVIKLLFNKIKSSLFNHNFSYQMLIIRINIDKVRWRSANESIGLE